MKTLMITFVFLLSVSAFAKDDKFEMKKAKALENVTKRIERLNAHKSCISSASDADALKECRKSMKSQMKDMKAKRKSMKMKRKQMKDSE